MKRTVSILAAVLMLALMINACAKQPASQNTENTAAPVESAPVTAAPTESKQLHHRIRAISKRCQRNIVQHN